MSRLVMPLAEPSDGQRLRIVIMVRVDVLRCSARFAGLAKKPSRLKRASNRPFCLQPVRVARIIGVHHATTQSPSFLCPTAPYVIFAHAVILPAMLSHARLDALLAHVQMAVCHHPMHVEHAERLSLFATDACFSFCHGQKGIGQRSKLMGSRGLAAGSSGEYALTHLALARMKRYWDSLIGLLHT